MSDSGPGRPSLYTPELLKKAWDYVDMWANYGDVVPSNESLAVHLKISASTLYSWMNDPEKTEFAEILGRLSVARVRELINNGLTGEYNSVISKVMLAKHGYTDKTETTNTHNHKITEFKHTIIDPAED